MSDNQLATDKPSSGDWMSRATTAIAIATALSYGYGWLYMQEYLGQVGAAWFLPSVPQQAIIGAGYPALRSLLLVAATGYWLMRSGATARSIDRITIVAIGVGTACFICAQLFAEPHGEVYGWLIGAYQTALSICVGYTLGEFVWGFTAGGYKWTSRNAFIALTVAVGVAYQIPSVSAEQRAHKDFSGTSALPQVTGSDLAGDWRVFAISGSDVLAGRLAAIGRPSAFAVVALHDKDVRVTVSGSHLNADEPPSLAEKPASSAASSTQSPAYTPRAAPVKGTAASTVEVTPLRP